MIKNILIILFLSLFLSCEKDRTFTDDYYSTLTGTNWVLTRYDMDITSYYPNDTLKFITDIEYTINSDSTLRTYSLWYQKKANGNTNRNMLNLELYNCSTLGGDYSGTILKSFNKDSVINNANFKQIYNNDKTTTIWMRKIK